MGDLYDAMRVVEGDVKPSDWVVVKGLLKARPGSEVKPQREKLTPPVTTPTPANPPGK
jgi:hypothetical protein